MATLYCDESGGVGRGVMTLAALLIDPLDAARILQRFRFVTGYSGEVKGSRIELGERALLFTLLEQTQARATIALALSATQPEPGEDRGLHDVHIYAELLEAAVGTMTEPLGMCPHILIDDGRYSEQTLAHIRADIAAVIGPCGEAALGLSHDADGLQLADVLANTFFNRALPGDRQARMAAIAQPMLESGQLRMHILTAEAERENESRKEAERRY